MFCKKCGAELADEAVFCNKCGNKVVKHKKNKWFIYGILSFLLIGSMITVLGKTILSKENKEVDLKDKEIIVKESIKEDGADKKKEQAVDYVQYISEHKYKKLEIEQKLIILVIAELQKASLIEINFEEESEVGKLNLKEELTSAVVDDVIDNVVLSEGTKLALKSISEDMSTEEIIEEVENKIVDYAKKEVTDYLKSGIDDSALKIFDKAKWIDSFLNVDDTPKNLLNGMIGLQEEDVNLLISIINKEFLDYTDILFIDGLYERISSRQEEIVNTGTGASKIHQVEAVENLISEWILEDGIVNVLAKELKNSEEEKQELTAPEKYQDIRKMKLAGLPAKYDVFVYREKQKAAEQGGMAIGAMLGDLLGAVSKDDLRRTAGVLQDSKIELYRMLEKSVLDSYYQASVSRTRFLELYNFLCNENSDLQITEVSKVLYDELDKYAVDYLGALNKYTYDVELAHMIWSAALADNKNEYWQGVEKSIEQQKQILDKYRDEGYSFEEYTEEEMNKKYIQIIDNYVQSIQATMLDPTSEGALSTVQTITAYGVGDFHVYLNGDKAILFAEEQLNSNWHAGRYVWLFNTDGEPIYLQVKQGNLYIRNGKILDFKGTTEFLQTDEMATKLLENANRIYQDYYNGNLGSNYENYAL